MKIVFFGDSITDASRTRGSADAGRVAEQPSILPQAYGTGYVFLIASQLLYEKPNAYEIINRGIGGDRLPQLYARIRLDVWNEQPDVLSILVGTNDVNDGENPNYTELERWGRIYRMMIRDTIEKCPKTKIMICEPFSVRENIRPLISEYAAEAKKIAQEFSLPFVQLQEQLEKAVEIYGMQNCFYDGTHPNLVGSKVISDAWLQILKSEMIKE